MNKINFKNMRQSLLVIILFVGSLFNSFIGNEAQGQSVTQTIQYGGFITECCPAGNVNYFCFDSPSNSGYCGNTTTCNTQNFFDPVPAGNIVTQIAVTYYTAGCAGGTMSGSLNGTLISSVIEGNTGCLCTGNQWAASGSTTANYPCGIANAGITYNYGANNSFQFCAAGQVCIDRVVLTISYVPANQAAPASQPGAITGNSPICVATAQNYSIPAVANAASYTWTVPAGWTINSGQGSTGINATPGSSGNICVTATNLCGTSAPTCFNVTVGPPVNPTFTQVNPICSGDPLAALPTTSNNGVTGTWSPGMNNTSTTTYTFTPTAGACANTANMTITVNSNTTPTFTQVNPICSGDQLAALPTTSNNGVTGTWSPGMNNTSTTTYTFTPSAGLCATTQTMTITVTPNTTPTFTQVNPICSGDPLAALPTTSNNGVTGTWSPAIDNTTTTAYTFTPSAGQCSPTTAMTITVNPNDDPNFAYASGSYCLTGTDPTPSVITTPGGTFSINAPGVINPTTGLIDLSASGLGTFTVYYNTTTVGNPCPSLDSVIVTVTASPTAGFTYDLAQYCQDSIAPILTINGGASSGVFTSNSGGLIIDAAGNITLSSSTPGIYTVYNNVAAAGGCAAALDSTTIEILQVDSALFNYASLSYCESETDPVANLTGTVGGVFTITAPGVINAGDGTIDLSGSGLGTFTVYYTTPAVNSCPALDSLQIIIDSVNTINPNPVIPICVTDPLILSVSSTGTGTITWYSDALGANVVGTGSPLILTNPGIGTFTYYVNNVGACSSSMDSLVVIVGGVNAVINATPVSGAIPLNVFFGNGSTTGPGITYAWDLGDGNTSNIFEPSNTYSGVGSYTVTLIVSDGICSDTATIIIDAFGESAILIPNIFSPNGDGSNDIFTVDGINLESVEGEIFNRWGQKMFSWSNVKGHWDGRTLSGSEAPAGTYFYMIKAKGFNGTEYFKKGGVSLVR
jgi:gliding motility-associated-like protein